MELGETMKIVDSFGDTLHVTTMGNTHVTIEVEDYAGIGHPIELTKQEWDFLVQQVAKELK